MGNSPLFYAVLHGNIMMVELLLFCGANVNYQNPKHGCVSGGLERKGFPTINHPHPSP